MQTVEVPDEILRLLQKSKLRDRPVEEQVRLVLAIHLLQEGVVSMGKAASIAGEPRASFELLLGEIGVPGLRYGLEDFRQDREAFQRARGE